MNVDVEETAVDSSGLPGPRSAHEAIIAFVSVWFISAVRIVLGHLALSEIHDG